MLLIEWGAFFLVFHLSYLILHRLLHSVKPAIRTLSTKQNQYLVVGGLALVIIGLGFPAINGEPLLAILISATILGLVYEFINVQIRPQTWYYLQMLFEQISVDSVQIVIIVSWAWRYIVFLSLEVIIFDDSPDLRK